MNVTTFLVTSFRGKSTQFSPVFRKTLQGFCSALFRQQTLPEECEREWFRIVQSDGGRDLKGGKWNNLQLNSRDRMQTLLKWKWAEQPQQNIQKNKALYS